MRRRGGWRGVVDIGEVYAGGVGRGSDGGYTGTGAGREVVAMVRQRHARIATRVGTACTPVGRMRLRRVKCCRAWQTGSAASGVGPLGAWAVYSRAVRAQPPPGRPPQPDWGSNGTETSSG